MKKDTKRKKIDWANHLMNFAAVCLGIIITFAGQGLINSCAERKEVKSSLLLVRNELQDNLSYIELSDSLMKTYCEAAKFLIRYEGHYNDAPADSMMMHCNAPLFIFDITHAEEALDLMKNSSLFTKIKDLNLSLEIIHTYGKIADEMKMVKLYNEQKEKYLDEAIGAPVKKILSQDNITAIQLWNAITSSEEGKQFLRELYRLQIMHDSSDTKQVIENTIREIDQYIN